MGTGNRKVNIFLKKFLTQQDITTNFLDYLHNLIMEGHQKLVPFSGIYTYRVTGRSDTVDTISFLTPNEINPADGNGLELEGDDGHGRILKLEDVRRVNVPVPNENSIKYFCGLRFNYFPNETEINVRTGKIKWSLFQEAIGERAEPSVVSYYNNQLTVKVDTICKEVDQVGRTLRVWLKEPVSQASGDIYEDLIIAKQSITFKHDGGLNYFDVPNELRDYFQLGQSLTINNSAPLPVTTPVTLVGAEDSGGSGFTRISVSIDLTAYTVVSGAYVLTGNNVVNLVGTLGQGTTPTVLSTDYELFLYGVTVTTQDLRNDEYYVYLLNYTGQGAGNNPDMFDNSDQREVPSDLGSIITEFKEFKEYQLQRNSVILRGGGQFSFKSGVLDWSDDFQIVNPFRGLYTITANSISSIINDNVIYSKIYKEQPVILNGNSSGEIWIEETTDFNNGDAIIVGDSDTNKIEGFISGVPGLEKIIIVDGGMTPIDLSNFTSANGAWVQRNNTSLYKGAINEGELRPDIDGSINDQIMIIAVCHNNVLIFKNGVLRLEDGDVGQISNLPSNFNWINTTTELVDSISKSGDGNVGILAPKLYTLTSKLIYNKNLSWVGLIDQTKIQGNLAEPLIEIKPDSTTSGSYQYVELKDLTLQNLGAGNVLQIDNTGATKGIEVVLDSCVLLANGGLSLNVIHGEPSQWIKLRFLNSRKEITQGSMVIESKNNNDDYIIDNVLFSPTDTITFGESATNPTSNLKITNCKLDKVIAVGTGTSKIIDIQDTYSWNYNKKIEIDGESSATFKVSQVIINHKEFSNYQKSRNSTLFKIGKYVSFASNVFTWSNPFEFQDAFYGLGFIGAGSLSPVINNDIVYTKIYKVQMGMSDGNSSGEIDVEDATIFSDNDQVLIGDNDSILISGYVYGSPVGNKLTIDDGVGTPINLSAITVSKGAWIRKTNLTMYKSQPNVGDLKPDIYGEVDVELFVIAKNHNGVLMFINGETANVGVVYEESIVVDSPISFGDNISLPLDSRCGLVAKYYVAGTADITIFVNGVKGDITPYELVSSFDPDAYTSGTGIVDIPDSVDLSLVRINDKFKDVDENEFLILGNIDNLNGQKKFRIAIGQTVNVGSGAIIIRQTFKEIGVGLSTQFQARIPIPVNAKITIRVIPVDKLAVGVGGAGGTLQDAYSGGASITIISGTPVVISGPAGQKLLRVLGDMEVTGVIDPKGITFSRNATKPWSDSQDGFWVDSDGKMKFYNKSTDSDEDISGVGEKQYTNPNPTTLIKGGVVTKAGVGNVQYADHNTDVYSRAIGILLGEIGEDDDASVKQFGYVESGVITSANFIEAELPVDNSRIWLHASGKMTISAPLEGSGFYETILGIWNDSGLNLQIQFLGKA